MMGTRTQQLPTQVLTTNYKGFNVHIQNKLVLTWVSPFAQDKKSWVLCWGKNRLSRYDIRAEGALLSSVTVIARVNNWAIGFAMFL